MLEKILTSINISENAQKVYNALLRENSISARALAEKISMPRATTYDALNSLINLGLVISREEDGRALFAVGDPNALDILVDQKIGELQVSKKQLGGVLQTIRKQAQTVEPKIRFFSEKEGVKKILNDILWNKNIETYTLWPMDEMLSLLGGEYLEWHNKKRVEQNISLKSIRKYGSKIDLSKYPYLGDKKPYLRDLAYAPKNMNFGMSYWIYADKVAFISALDTTFGFIVHSKEFSHMLRLHFNLLWGICKKVDHKIKR